MYDCIPRARRRIADLQDGLCFLCGWPLAPIIPQGTPFRRRLKRALAATDDHVIPRAFGATREHNLLVAHKCCNERKASRPPFPCELIFLEAINMALAAAQSAAEPGGPKKPSAQCLPFSRSAGTYLDNVAIRASGNIRA